MNVLPTPPRRRAASSSPPPHYAAVAPSPGVAGSLDACAQRVIRDWYTRRPHRRRLSARLLPRCDPRAPERRAAVLERRPGHPPRARVRPPRADRSGEQGKPLPAAPKAPDDAGRGRRSDGEGAADGEVATAGRGDAEAGPRRRTRPRPPVSKAPIVAETTSSATSVPYPILVLAALAAVLLLAGGAGWLANRRPLSRRRSGPVESRSGAARIFQQFAGISVSSDPRPSMAGPLAGRARTRPARSPGKRLG